MLTVNTSSTSSDRKQLIWPVVGIGIGALARTNPFYEPHITLEVGVTAWLVDMVLVLILSCHPFTARVGVLVAGLFMAVPCFLRALPMYRFLLMCGMAFTFAITALQLFAAPTAGFRWRLAYVFTWLGTREVKRHARSFDAVSLLHLIVATLVHVAGVAAVKAVTPSGIWWLARWLAGGITLLAFAEMTTAGHYFLTALMGISAPALMRSPHLSASIREFWAERWNPAASALVFGVLPGFPGGFWLAETEVTGLEPPKTLGTGVLGPSTAGRRELRLKAPRPARLVRGRMSMDSRRKAALRRLAGAAARKHWRPLNFGSARIANEQSPGDS